MSRKEDIDNAIWTDPDFSSLSPNAKLLYLWSFTNPYCGMSGVYRISARRMAWDLGLDDAVAATALRELGDAQMVIYEGSVIWVRTRVKHLRSRSPQMARSIAKDIEKFPDGHPIRTRFLEMYATQPWLRDQLAVLTGDFQPHHIKAVKPSKPGTFGEGIDPIHPMEPIQVPGQWQGQGQGSSSSGSERVELPDGFPRELRPHLRSAFKVLSSLAERHNAKAVSPLSLAGVVMARPRKPLVRAAYDCAAYWDGRSQRLRDVVAAYRNWLDRIDDLASVEALDNDGMRASTGRVAATNTSTRDERQARRLSALQQLANEGGAA